eukprot:SAG22_NODE_1320_length_4757_cov_28.614498_4_plen_97_part_00
MMPIVQTHCCQFEIGHNVAPCTLLLPEGTAAAAVTATDDAALRRGAGCRQLEWSGSSGTHESIKVNIYGSLIALRKMAGAAVLGVTERHHISPYVR